MLEIPQEIVTFHWAAPLSAYSFAAISLGPGAMEQSSSVAIVGAGFISNIHAEALASLPSIALRAVVDGNPARATALARKWRIPNVYSDLRSLIEAGDCTAAHVLVPPDRHREVAEQLLRAGIAVFLEKPMATSSDDCRLLNDAAMTGGASLGINQNFLFHTGYQKLKHAIATQRLGRVRHLAVTYNMPLRQLSMRQFGHWMFREPKNILLEQAVHPLSHIRDLLGPIARVDAVSLEARELEPGQFFHPKWQISLQGQSASAQLFLSFGASFPAWSLRAICDDGEGYLDLAYDRLSFVTRSKWPDFYDSFLSAIDVAGSHLLQGARNLSKHMGSMLHLSGRSDPFYAGMRRSIEAFHNGLRRGTIPVSGALGAELVGLCERIAKQADASFPPRALRDANIGTDSPSKEPTIAVIGGTGFIGSHLLRRFARTATPLRVMARNAGEKAIVLPGSCVAYVDGDVARMEDIERAIGDAAVVVNLAPGASGSSPEELERSMKEAAINVAECCLSRKVQRLVHVSSIAALYLGDRQDRIGHDSRPDPMAHRRSEYARAKAAIEAVLLTMHAERGLPVCILRPGIVVGEGGAPFHSALGYYNAERHCLGWNRGDNPLPFVLAQDVAEAIRLATAAPGVSGQAYNLVGDVRLTAREYVKELGRALERPLEYHPQAPAKVEMLEIIKWMVKSVVRRQKLPFPSYRDLMSRGMLADIDCSDAKRHLGWVPEGDRSAFIRRGIDVHRSP